MPDVNINLGTDGSTIRDSNVAVGNVAAAADQRFDALWTEIQDVKLRLSQIEGIIEGNLGMPGISAQLLSVQQSMFRIEKELSLLNNEKYLVSKGVFFGVLALLILMVGVYLFTK